MYEQGNEYITKLLWDDHTFQWWKFVWDEIRVAAIVFHCSAFYPKEDGEYVTDDIGKKVNDNEKRHQYCPRTADTNW